MRTDYVPVDEGEAEAQPDLPPLTITLMHEGGQQAPLPWTVRFHVPAAGMRRAAVDGLLLTGASRWLAESGYAFEGDDRPGWADTEDGRCRVVTYTLTGFA